jgi:uncharacterized protein YceH (UPF0502 family)
LDQPLDPIETRVLGCLIEKELATPEYYPLSLNALVAACNQRSNRDPVMELAEAQVLRALASLRERRLAMLAADVGRVQRHRHCLDDELKLDEPSLAVLAELLLRGPQTAGELRARIARMVELPDQADFTAVLDALQARTPPLLALLPRQSGRKEPRLAQLLSPLPEAAAPGETQPFASAPPPTPPTQPDPALEARVAALKAQVAALQAELAELSKALLG